ncbi:hypothetical protein [Glutamicibacter sp.]|nr:hypothetical protein [Glutamicibacter sp.]
MSSWDVVVLCLGAYAAASPAIAYGLYRWLSKSINETQERKN